MKTFNKIVLLLILAFIVMPEAKAQNLVGTWKYLNTSLASETAIKVKKQKNSDIQFNKKLSANLIKAGFRSGSTLTFNQDQTFVQRVNQINYEGTYTCSQDSKNLTLNFNNGDKVDISLEFVGDEVSLKMPGYQFPMMVNIVESKQNLVVKDFISSFVTQYENTHVVMKYVK
ncbi:MAG: DUF4923 family protein [Bacteroidales bacterium]|jgi:hypothetical protein|nr:DUF4923 family protein [Bacteroidales bacterium]